MSEETGFRRAAAAALDVTGEDRESNLQGQCTNDVVRADRGAVLPAALLSPKGKLLFVLRIAKSAERLRLLSESDQIESLRAHLSKYAIGQRVEFRDRRGDLCRFDLYGRIPPGLPPAPEGRHREEMIEGASTEIWPCFSEIGATWLAPADAADRIDDYLVARLRRIGDDEVETRRIEAGRPADGRDMDGSCLPDEVGLEETISRTKGCYVGQEIVARLRTYGHVNRRLVGFTFSSGPLPLAGAIFVRAEEPEKEAARVTSVALSDRFGTIGLGYARREVADGEVLRLREDPARTARVRPPACR